MPVIRSPLRILSATVCAELKIIENVKSRHARLLEDKINLWFWRKRIGGWQLCGGKLRQIICCPASRATHHGNASVGIGTQDRARPRVIMRLANQNVSIRTDDRIIEGARSALRKNM